MAPAVIATVAVSIAGALTLPGGGSAQGAVREPNSADSLIVWTACEHVLELTDAALDLWKSRGVDGFACMHGKLRHMGGSQDFTGHPGASLAGSNYKFQRSLRDTNIVGRMRARGMKAYLGLQLANYYNTATPLKDGSTTEAGLTSSFRRWRTPRPRRGSSASREWPSTRSSTRSVAA